MYLEEEQRASLFSRFVGVGVADTPCFGSYLWLEIEIDWLGFDGHGPISDPRQLFGRVCESIIAATERGGSV